MRQNSQKEQKQDIEVLCLISARITSYWSLTQYNDGHKPSVSLKCLNGPKKAPFFGSPCSRGWSLPALQWRDPPTRKTQSPDHVSDTESPFGFASLTHKLTWEFTSCYLVVKPSNILIPFITPGTQCCH